MIDVFEKTTLQDIIAAKTFGIDEDEVKRLSLHQMKNELHNKAFDMRDNNQVITQEEADVLNKKLEEIVDELIGFNYDPMCDYYVNFDSFVPGNSYYDCFAW